MTSHSATAALLAGIVLFFDAPGILGAEEDAGQPQLIIDPRGHAGMVRELLFAPDGSQLISLGDDKAIRFWDVETGELRRTLRGMIGDGHVGKLFAGAISADGRWLAVAGYPIQWGIRVIDLTSGEIAAVLRGHTNVIPALAFSPDGRWLASGSSDKDSRVWDLGRLGEGGAGKIAEIGESQVLKGHSAEIYAVSFSKDGNRLVTGAHDKTLILWERARSTEPFQRVTALNKHDAEVASAAFSPDGRHIVSGGFDNQLILWDGATGAFNKVLDADMGSAVNTVTFAPDSQRVLASSQGSGRGTTAIYDLGSGKQVATFPHHNNSVSASAWHPTGNLVATSGGNDNDIYLWNPAADAASGIKAGDISHHIVGRGSSVWSTAFAKADGLRVAFGQTSDPKLNLGEDKLEQTFDFLQFARADFREKGDASNFRRTVPTADGNTLKKIDPYTVEVGNDGTVKNDPASFDQIRSFSFTPDGSGVIVSSSASLKLYEKSGTGFATTHEFVGHTGEVWAVSPSPDGRYLASVSIDQTVRLWDLKAGALLASLFVSRDQEWVIWTPSGHYHASPGGEKFIGWHLNKAADQMGEYFPSYVFRDQFHKPELVKQTIALGSFEEALAEVETKVVEVKKVLPPKVDWLLPTEVRGENAKGEATVKVKVASPGAELEVVKLLLNGKSVSADFEASGNEMTFEKTVELLPGENRLSIFARNEHSGHTSTERVVFFRKIEVKEPEVVAPPDPDPEPDPDPDPSVAADPPPTTGADPETFEDLLKPNLYMMSVGVSKYENADIELEFCDDDAEAMAAVFAAQKGKLFKNVEVLTLTNEKATRLAVLDGLNWLEKNATQKDFVVLFLAAHGANDSRGNYYLLPTGGDFKNLRGTGVAWDDFADVLGNLPAKTLMFLDTCHSGQLGKNLFAFAKRGDGDSIDDASEAIRELTSEENGVVIMSAATGAEDSVEHEDWGHGAFTMAILDGMVRKGADLNKDGIIHLRELDFYVSDRVKELTGGIQHPTTVKPSTISRLPIAAVGR